MAAIADFLYMIDDFMWGTWMTILLVGVGIIFSIRFSFRYQWKIAFNFKNTFAKIGAKGEGEGTVSGFRAACTALANTVGTGNISGVATAIVSGGPGALVWMWVSAFFGMSTKSLREIRQLCLWRYRKESENDAHLNCLLYASLRHFLQHRSGSTLGLHGHPLRPICLHHRLYHRRQT